MNLKVLDQLENRHGKCRKKSRKHNSHEKIADHGKKNGRKKKKKKKKNKLVCFYAVHDRFFMSVKTIPCAPLQEAAYEP